VPIQITSLRAPDEVVQSAHSYGGLVYHDVTNVKHAKRALQAGVDGLILVCAGAGGHAGIDTGIDQGDLAARVEHGLGTTGSGQCQAYDGHQKRIKSNWLHKKGLKKLGCLSGVTNG